MLSILVLLHSPSMLAVKAKNHGVLYKQYSSIAFDETSSYWLALKSCMYVCMCMYSNSRNDVPRVAQRYGTIAAHTQRRASVLVVFVVFCVHMYSFAGLIRRTPPPTFSDTAITDRHSDTTNFQLRAHWVRISWSIGSE